MDFVLLVSSDKGNAKAYKTWNKQKCGFNAFLYQYGMPYWLFCKVEYLCRKDIEANKDFLFGLE